MTIKKKAAKVVKYRLTFDEVKNFALANDQDEAATKAAQYLQIPNDEAAAIFELLYSALDQLVVNGIVAANKSLFDKLFATNFFKTPTPPSKSPPLP